MSRVARLFGFVCVFLMVWLSPPDAVAQLAAQRTAPRPDTAQLVLPTKRPEQLKVESVKAAEPAPVVKAAPSGGSSIAVKAGEQWVIRDLAEAAATSKPTALREQVKAPMSPTLVVGVRDLVKGTTVTRQFQPFLAATVSPLRWDAAAKSYVTTVVVGLDPLPGEDAGGALELPEPIGFHLSAENVDKLEPADLDVRQVGVAGYQRFMVYSWQFDRPIRVTAHSKFGDKLYEAGIDPGPAFIQLGRSAESVDGFGLARVTISVRRYAANHQLLPPPSDSRIHLQTSGGYLDPAHVDLSARSAIGETSLVSATWGKTVVSQTDVPADASGNGSTTTVEFAFPALKFLFGLLGAASAGALRVLTVKRARRQGWAPVFIGCLASGITVDILVALGAPIAPAWLLSIIRSELAWFAIGLVAGYPGISVVARLGEKWFASKHAEPAQSSA